jgi:hypothetical protein
MRKLTVIRFDAYPSTEAPEGVAIRFLLETNGRKDTKETLIPIDECIDPLTGETYPAEVVVELSLNRNVETDPPSDKTFRDEILTCFSVMESKPSVIGMDIPI